MCSFGHPGRHHLAFDLFIFFLCVCFVFNKYSSHMLIFCAVRARYLFTLILNRFVGLILLIFFLYFISIILFSFVLLQNIKVHDTHYIYTTRRAYTLSTHVFFICLDFFLIILVLFYNFCSLV